MMNKDKRINILKKLSDNDLSSFKLRAKHSLHSKIPNNNLKFIEKVVN